MLLLKRTCVLPLLALLVVMAGEFAQPVSAITKNNAVPVLFFWGKGCPHCEREKKALAELQRTDPALVIKQYEVWYNKRNAALLSSLLDARGMRSSGVPVTFINDRVFSGFSSQTQLQIIATIEACRSKRCMDPADVLKQSKDGPSGASTPSALPAIAVAAETAGKSIEIPLLGALDAKSASLPLLTLVIAGLDSFNPCAFFVLLTLLGLLVHARSRNRMLLIGGVFVFFSGFVYFLFMAAWLNLFLVMGHVAIITTIAGLVSIAIASINIKDFFIFKQGISLSIPDVAKPKLFDRMRKLLRSTSLFPILAGAIVLAVVANSYELLCTVGFPMVFTRVLTLHALPVAVYYLYVVLYNIIYVVPLSLIVLVFTMTLGSRKLSEQQGRLLKLVSGMMMLSLGGVLLIDPSLLNNVVMSFILLLGALVISSLVAGVAKKLGHY